MLAKQNDLKLLDYLSGSVLIQVIVEGKGQVAGIFQMK